MAIGALQKPLVAQGWMRTVIFLLTYAVILFLISFSGQFFQMVSSNPKAIDAATATSDMKLFPLLAITAVISILLVWVFRKLVDRERFESLGLGFSKQGVHAATGFFLGLAMITMITLFLIGTKNLEWTDVDFDGNTLFLGFGMMLLIAVSEEIVFRGYVLNNLMQNFSRWVALGISAIIFMLFHAANPGIASLPAINILLAGVLMGVNYMYTKNLWFGIALHFSWNFAQGSIFGYKVSGIHLQSLLRQELNGDDLYTGGAFGLEGSAYTTLVLVLAISLLIWIYERKTVRVKKNVVLATT